MHSTAYIVCTAPSTVSAQRALEPHPAEDAHPRPQQDCLVPCGRAQQDDGGKGVGVRAIQCRNVGHRPGNSDARNPDECVEERGAADRLELGGECSRQICRSELGGERGVEQCDEGGHPVPHWEHTGQEGQDVCVGRAVHGNGWGGGGLPAGGDICKAGEEAAATEAREERGWDVQHGVAEAGVDGPEVSFVELGAKGDGQRADEGSAGHFAGRSDRGLCADGAECDRDRQAGDATYRCGDGGVQDGAFPGAESGRPSAGGDSAGSAFIQVDFVHKIYKPMRYSACPGRVQDELKADL
ncbi:uncharacterized protein T551_01511 [Pneumocystis jirovecii RU7]|uniref:Uncharacterized protein n=1 Tax=Pneumocystis jirovecii (strain RU7) TaxID=1408657 RepID=A0A0W4ZRH1_PNEJ7|nr:uncharacterized protein T551_01511 [Pneumocystis jirovecii RU7]KTW30959.1 hypothetical protein T551_01511 [Pneumocystis jirovecii RU7]